jgi:hypothetical protein
MNLFPVNNLVRGLVFSRIVAKDPENVPSDQVTSPLETFQVQLPVWLIL